MTYTSDFQANIAIRTSGVSGEKRWDISFFAPSTEIFDVQSKQGVLRTLQDDSIGLVVEAITPSAGAALAYAVRATAPGRIAELAEITVADPALVIHEVAIARELRNVLQLAFFQALRDAQSAISAVDVMNVPVQYSTAPDKPGIEQIALPKTRGAGLKGWFQRMTFKRAVVSVVVLLGVGLTVSGFMPKTASDPLGDVAKDGGYGDMQAKIKRQIHDAVNSDRPAIGGLQGQAIAIETMKSMGLDPGKANAGCLVGAK